MHQIIKDTKKPKLLMVVGDFPPLISGVGDYTFCLLNQLYHKGLDVSVITTRNHQQEIPKGLYSHNIMRVMTKWSFIETIKIIRIIKKMGTDTIVHIQYHCPHTYGKKPMINFLPLILRLCCPINKLIITHHEFIRVSWRYKLRALLMSIPCHGVICGTAIADQMIVSSTNFLTGIILGRSLTKEQFGIYMLGLSIILVITNIQTSLILTPYTVFLPQLKGNERQQYHTSSFQLFICYAIIIGLLLLIAGFIASQGFGPTGLDKILFPLAGASAFILLRDYVRRICFAHLQVMVAFWLDILVALIQIGSLLLFLHIYGPTSSLAFIVIGFACFIPGVGYLALKDRRLSVETSIVSRNLYRNWIFARWIFAGTLVTMVNNQLYPWILAVFHGNASTGELNACMGALFLANPFLLGMGRFLSPMAAHIHADKGSEALYKTTGRWMVFFVLIMFMFCIFISVFGGSLVVLFYGEKYGGSAIIVRILALNLFFVALSMPVNSSLSAMERPDIKFKTDVAILPITLTIGLWLSKSYGTIGVALGLLLGNSIACSFRCIAYRKLARDVIYLKLIK